MKTAKTFVEDLKEHLAGFFEALLWATTSMNQSGRTGIRYRNGLDSGFSCCAATEPKKEALPSWNCSPVVTLQVSLDCWLQVVLQKFLPPSVYLPVIQAPLLRSHNKFGFSVFFLVTCKYLSRRGEFRLIWIHQLKELTPDQYTTHTDPPRLRSFQHLQGDGAEHCGGKASVWECCRLVVAEVLRCLE